VSGPAGEHPLQLPSGAVSPSVIVLCGGAGSRAGGVEKALLDLGGEPIIARIAAALAPWPLLVSANRALDRYAAYGCAVRDGAFEGPLAGLLATLSQVDTETVFVCPGDCPGVSRELAERLLAPLERGATASCAHDGTRLQPLHLALRSEVQASLADYLATGARSVHGWLTELSPVAVDCADLPLAFDDIDEAGDLARWQARLA
jgi:molybdopterin-guanine dinucleotide biosynthesis protein A